MEQPSKYLKEGFTYPFIVQKEIVLPDGSEAWILRDIKNRQILLEKRNYRRYPIEAGLTLFCRVDKINCSGKIFLEPPHPVYRENENFDFCLIKSYHTGERGLIAVVKDVFGNEINVDLTEKTISKICGDKVRLKVKYVKKGIPMLIDPELQLINEFEEKKEYEFFVESLQELMNEASFFVLNDKAGNKHFIPAKWYKDFGIRVGEKITCEVVKISTGGQPILEPIHPEYKRGEVYQMRFMGEEELLSSKREFRHVVVIANHKREKFYILKKHFSEATIPLVISCKVEKYRKGRIYFEPVTIS